MTMLLQADRFGTSLAESLRVHADMLRTRRQLKAEEAAAKIALKLLFPLIFCIFPSLMLVLMAKGIGPGDADCDRGGERPCLLWTHIVRQQ